MTEIKKQSDAMREICIGQGYTLPKCKLPGMIILGLIIKGECPCDGCNIDRSECGGKPKKY